MEPILLEIRKALNAVSKIRDASFILRNSAIATKEHVRIMVGRSDWSDVIMEAKNLTHFLDEDALSMTDQMCEAVESVDELKNLLDDMRI